MTIKMFYYSFMIGERKKQKRLNNGKKLKLTMATEVLASTMKDNK